MNFVKEGPFRKFFRNGLLFVGLEKCGRAGDLFHQKNGCRSSRFLNVLRRVRPPRKKPEHLFCAFIFGTRYPKNRAAECGFRMRPCDAMRFSEKGVCLYAAFRILQACARFIVAKGGNALFTQCTDAEIQGNTQPVHPNRLRERERREHEPIPGIGAAA